MYENESWNQLPEDWTREERSLDAHLERQEAKARRELAEGLTELREFTGHAHVAAPVASALNGWLAAMSAKGDWGYAPLTPGSEVVAADPLSAAPRKPAALYLSKGVAPRGYAVIMPGIAVRTGSRRKNRRAA